MKFAMGSAALALALVCAAPASATVVFVTGSGSGTSGGYTQSGGGQDYTFTADVGTGFSGLYFNAHKSGAPLTITATLSDGSTWSEDYSAPWSGRQDFSLTTNDADQLFTSVVLHFDKVPNNFGVTGISGSTALPVSDPVTPPVVAAVPEPATWAMMLAGFGLVGMGVRRRSRMAVSLA